MRLLRQRLRRLLAMTVILLPCLYVSADADPYLEKRMNMVRNQIQARGIADPKVLEAMSKIERHRFVPEKQTGSAYDDYPLPIGYHQTISQPYVVAFMTDAARLKPDDRVLEIGTGSGYQAAILGELASEVYSIEIVKPLADRAQEVLSGLGYKNVFVRHGNGYEGWPEAAPFDVIVVTAAPGEIPKKLIEQLKVGGRMVIPVGSFFQDLYLITKTETGVQKDKLLPVRFVPMVQS